MVIMNMKNIIWIIIAIILGALAVYCFLPAFQ